MTIDDINWSEDPLGPYYSGDSAEIKDAEGVSLSSLSSTGNPPLDAVFNSSVTDECLLMTDRDDTGAQTPAMMATQSALTPFDPILTIEQLLRSSISSCPRPAPTPAIIHCSDSHGAIHFQESPLPPNPPFLSPSSSQSFASQSRDSFAAAGGLVVLKPSGKAALSPKPLPKLPKHPVGHDGHFTSTQKGKKKASAFMQKDSLCPELLYPKNFELVKQPAKEKAGDRDIWIEHNLFTSTSSLYMVSLPWIT
ncbi:hypothetical protein EV368DRAFT_68504 [Lentinula lateritia]|uniref:Uncharacterized protein n=1 Tax=Lentinula aff. lateritia TaxID=2804960 RepID=A0ACC1TLF7_9AGAR|nr:hypothetical protein F5876DRAFT_69786 [Lentinula aff. lateritia]KAJ3848170.1 hypothetical protein EV368DRAFT_68504 [Lentinula lateritia]